MREELYDLMLDPRERDNLIGEEDYQSVKDEMRQLLETWQKRQAIRFLQGAEDMSAGRRDLLYNGFLQYKDSGNPPEMQKVSGRAAWSAAEQY